MSSEWWIFLNSFRLYTCSVRYLQREKSSGIKSRSRAGHGYFENRYLLPLNYELRPVKTMELISLQDSDCPILQQFHFEENPNNLQNWDFFKKITTKQLIIKIATSSANFKGILFFTFYDKFKILIGPPPAIFRANHAVERESCFICNYIMLYWHIMLLNFSLHKSQIWHPNYDLAMCLWILI